MELMCAAVELPTEALAVVVVIFNFAFFSIKITASSANDDDAVVLQFSLLTLSLTVVFV